MRVSVQTAGLVVALDSMGILALSVASAAISTERQQQYSAKKAAGEHRGQGEASAVNACLAADPPPASAERSQDGGTSKLREAPQ